MAKIVSQRLSTAVLCWGSGLEIRPQHYLWKQNRHPLWRVDEIRAGRKMVTLLKEAAPGLGVRMKLKRSNTHMTGCLKAGSVIWIQIFRWILPTASCIGGDAGQKPLKGERTTACRSRQFGSDYSLLHPTTSVPDSLLPRQGRLEILDALNTYDDTRLPLGVWDLEIDDHRKYYAQPAFQRPNPFAIRIAMAGFIVGEAGLLLLPLSVPNQNEAFTFIR